MLDRAAQVQPEQVQHRAFSDDLGQLVDQAGAAPRREFLEGLGELRTGVLVVAN